MLQHLNRASCAPLVPETGCELDSAAIHENPPLLSLFWEQSSNGFKLLLLVHMLYIAADAGPHISVNDGI